MFSQESITHSFIKAHIQKDTVFFFNPNRYEWHYKIVFISDSVYKVTGLFHADSTESIVFKKESGRIYFRKNKKWKLFFDKDCLNKFKWTVGSHSYYGIWKKVNFKDGNNEIYTLEFEPIGFVQSASTVYYFTYNEGVIAIDSHDEDYVRSDKMMVPFRK
ncbi:MAG: hypothetical protein H0W84_09750 [Bacteroidetes bacterium]|nr:hypothetical protein [Bacteroidota bacterium]